jgi:hypothetical protein
VESMCAADRCGFLTAHNDRFTVGLPAGLVAPPHGGTDPQYDHARGAAGRVGAAQLGAGADRPQRVYRWPVGQWSQANVRLVPPANRNQYYVSSAPVWVPDSTPGSGGWDGCGSFSDEGFACYALAGPGSIFGTMAGLGYYTTPDGAPVTAFAVVVPIGPGGALTRPR